VTNPFLDHGLKVIAARLSVMMGLPKNPASVINKAFIFGDQDHFVIGTIISIGYGPSETRLYVTTPRFRGMDIHHITMSMGQWIAVSADNQQYKPGKLELL